jgi:hypothetical protein
MGKKGQDLGIPVPAGLARSGGKWIAPDGTMWAYELTWGEVDGRAECVGVNLTTTNSGGRHERAVTAQRLRQLPLGHLIEEKRRTLRTMANDPEWAKVAPNAQKQAATAFANGSRRLTGPDGSPLPVDDALRLVAEVYQAAWARRPDPTAAVAEAFGLSKSAAAKRVARARARGFLPPTTQGKPGGVPARSRKKGAH